MIVRVFRVRTHPGREADFKRFMVETGRPGLLKREGCVGVILGQDVWNERPLSLIISLWDSVESLKKWGGEEWQQGHINPAAADFIEQIYCDNFERIE